MRPFLDNIKICSAYNVVSAGLHFIPFAAVYLLYFRNIFSLVNGLYHPVSRGRIAPIVSTVLNTDDRDLCVHIQLLFQLN